MSPRGLPRLSDLSDHPCREASVLLLLHPFEGTPSVVLIERPTHLSKHAGQIAFPGGRREEGESRWETALRETREEIGISTDRVVHLGALTPLFIPPTSFCVYPFVAWVETLGSFTLDAGEVASAFSAPLRLFVDGPREVVSMPGLGRTVPAFPVMGHTVWGATAMILAELARVAEPALPGG
jgi:8-oxo-dGTP pyrophosphatase MutT (NUDIX family)